MSCVSKNIILTGERGSGKSTLCDKLALASNKRTGGLKTFFKEDRYSPHSYLYACGWGEEPVFDEAHIVARFGGGKPRALTEVFDTLCAGLIYEAISSDKTELIIIDELGFLEKEALIFKSAVLKALESEKPVIAVIRQGLPEWTKEAAQKGRIYQFAEANRNELFLKLSKTQL